MIAPIEDYGKVLVKDLTEYDRLLAEMETQSVIAFDTETTGLDTLTVKIVGVSFYFGSGTGYYVIGDLFRARKEKFQALINTKYFVFHNGKYEDQVCRQLGVSVFRRGNFCDTQVMDYLVDPDGEHGLKECEKRYFNWNVQTYEELFKDIPLELADPTQVYVYACVDAIGTYELFFHHKPKMEEFKEILAIDLALIPVISQMETLGIRMDTKFLSSYKVPLLGKIDEIREEIYKLAGTQFEIDSTAQVGEVLFDGLKLPPIGGRGKNGKWKTSALVLEQLSNRHPIVPKILLYRELFKMSSNYVDSILERLGPDGICRPSYLQTVVPTGRLASSKGSLTGGACNIQQIPKRGKVLSSERRLNPEEIESYKVSGAKLSLIKDDLYHVDLPVKPRRAFLPREGYYLVSADYKAIEFRIMVLLANERAIINEILDGVDVHISTACAVFGVTSAEVTPEMRDAAKTLNYAVLYGMDYHGLMTRLKITEEEARLIYTRFMQRIPNTQSWIKDIHEFAKKNHYIKTFFGRRRYIWDLVKYRELTDTKERKRLFSRGLRGAVNSVVQGTAADIMRMAMIRVADAFEPFGDDVHLLASVHDQVLGEVRHHVPLNDILGVLKTAMEFPVGGWDLPMEVEFEVGPNWGDQKKAYYEAPGRIGLSVALSESVAKDKLLKFKHALSKHKGDKPVVVTLPDGKPMLCKEKIPAADEVFLAVKGALGPGATLTWETK